MKGGSEALIDMELSHPLFPDRTIKVVPHKNAKPGIGTGIVPITPAHDIESLDHADMFNLGINGFVDQDGKYKDDLGEEYAGIHVHEAGNSLISQFLEEKQAILTKYLFQNSYDRIKETKE